MAILNIFEQLSKSAGIKLRMYNEMSSDKRGVVILRHFAPDRAFGTYVSQVIPWGQISLEQLSYPILN